MGRRYLLTGVLLIAAGAAGARGQVTPPPQPVDCRAAVTDLTIGPRSTGWFQTRPRTPLRPPQGWWWASWNWTLDFECGAGAVSQCWVCRRVEVDRKTGANPTGWVVAKIINCPTVGGNCFGRYTKTTRTRVTNLEGNTVYRATWYYASWDPALSADCFGQDYIEGGVDIWKFPVDPS